MVRTRRRWLHAVTALACTTALVASCSKTDGGGGAATASSAGDQGGRTLASGLPKEKDAGPPKPGGKLVVGLAAETDSFNPFVGQWSVSSHIVANAVMDPLTALDEIGIAHPYLAQGIEPTPDLKQWTITLRPGIRFHNNEVLDANVVKKNLDTGRNSGLTSQAFAAIADVTVAGDLTVKVTMNKPWGTFPAALASQAGYMAAPAMLDDPAKGEAKVIGTGPFLFTERVRDSYLRASKNPSYWRKDRSGSALPYLDAVEFKIINDTTSRTNALKAGDIDALVSVTPDGVLAQNEAAQRGEVQLITDAGQETDETVLAMNTSKEPFDDPIARQALAYGIDQEQISNEAYQGAFPGAWGMFEKDSPYYISPEEAGYPKRDTGKAKSLVREYESKHGKPLEFTALIPSDPQYLAIAQHVQEQAAAIGVKVRIETIEQTVMIRRVIASGDYQASGFLVWSSPTPDRAYIFLATKANANGLSLNFSRFDDAALSAAMDDFRAAADPQKRIDAIKVVQKELAKNLQVLFLVHNRSAFAYSLKVHGVRATTFDGTDRPAYTPYVTSPFITAAWKG